MDRIASRSTNQIVISGSWRALLGRRYGLAEVQWRKATDRPGEQILAEVQWRLNTLVSGGGFLPTRRILGPILWIFLDGGIPRYLANLRNNGSCPRWRGKKV